MKAADTLRPSSEISFVLIEPDEAFAAELATQIQALGYELDHYRSVRELGYIGRLKDFDLLLTNLRIDDMSGLELVDYSRKLLSGMPVIILADDARELTDLRCEVPLIAGLSKQIGAHALALKILEKRLSLSESIDLDPLVSSELAQESS